VGLRAIAVGLRAIAVGPRAIAVGGSLNVAWFWLCFVGCPTYNEYL